MSQEIQLRRVGPYQIIPNGSSIMPRQQDEECDWCKTITNGDRCRNCGAPRIRLNRTLEDQYFTNDIYY